jgi:hypothetical protein
VKQTAAEEKEEGSRAFRNATFPTASRQPVQTTPTILS